MKEVIIGMKNGKMAAAFMQDGELLEYIIEKDTDVFVGNIYRARITDALNNMNTVFADIGQGNIVYLQTERARYKPGNSIILQIKKEPFSAKNAAATDLISLTGRYSVLFFNSGHVGVSRKISDEDEAKRLLGIAKRNKPENMGVIIRTVAVGIAEKVIVREIKKLAEKLYKIVEKGSMDGGPEALYVDKFFPDKILRDKIDSNINSIVIEGIELYDVFYNYLKENERPEITKLKLHTGEHSVFTVYDVNAKLIKALSRRVWLPCGGFVVFDKTEAMTVIDVNTGKYAGSRELASSILKVNKEAATEIAKQIRLRDIGGIIIIDFIDMKDEDSKKELLLHLEKEVKKDKAKTVVLGLTKLGLVEMTRKRTGEGLYEVLEKAGFIE